MAASRSARKRRSTRTAPAQPVILTDARLLPGIVGKAVEEGLNPIARRLLALEGRVDGHASPVAIGDDAAWSRGDARTASQIHPDLPRAPQPKGVGRDGPSGIVEDAADRVRSLTQRVQGARNILRSKYERLFGSIPEASGKGEASAPALNGDVHVLHSVISDLDAAIDSLHHEVDRLAGL